MTEQTGGGAIADSAAEVQLRAREQLLQGASQLKVVGGGGVSSPRSPLARWYGNAEILTMATATNAELPGLFNLRNPYPGRLGVLEEGAFADLLLVDVDPLTDITLVANLDKNFLIVMKDGKIYKDKISE